MEFKRISERSIFRQKSLLLNIFLIAALILAAISVGFSDDDSNVKSIYLNKFTTYSKYEGTCYIFKYQNGQYKIYDVSDNQVGYSPKYSFYLFYNNYNNHTIIYFSNETKGKMDNYNNISSLPYISDDGDSPTDTCKANILKVDLKNNEVIIKPNFNPKQYISNCTSSSGYCFFMGCKDSSKEYPIIKTDLPKPPEGPSMRTILQANYWMKTKITFVLYKKNLQSTNFGSEDHSNSYSYSQYYTKIETKYLKYGNNTFELPLTKDEIGNKFGIGYFKWEVITQPIDPKCDFNNNDKLDNDENNHEYLVIQRNSSEFQALEQMTEGGLYFQGIPHENLGINNNGIFFDGAIINLQNIENRFSWFADEDNVTKLKQIIIVKKAFRTTNYTQLINRLNKTLNITQKTIKKINYIPTQNKVEVQINKTAATKYSNSGKKLTYYAYIPKGTNLSKVKVHSSTPLKVFWVELDPIIGWEFQGPPSDVNITGVNNSVVVVATQTPIVFNNGNLIVNYRYGSCNANELNLFQVQNLSGGKLSLDNTYPWKVCLSSLLPVHLSNSSIIPNNIELFKDNSGYYSTTTGIPIHLSTGNQTYWLKEIISHNSLDNYSCIASFDPTTGKIGDCGFTTNYIWVRLDKDTQPPQIKLLIPRISHSLRVSIQATDDLSGVKTVKYCIDNTGSCTPNTLYKNPFYVTCNTPGICQKELRIYAEDNAGNSITINKNLTIAAPGSICTSKCTLVPKPGRISSACDGYAGCKFYDDRAKSVCDMKRYGSIVKYDDTHDILCPNGPLMPTIFTPFTLSITSNRYCNTLFKQSFPVIVHSEVASLDIYFCIR